MEEEKTYLKTISRIFIACLIFFLCASVGSYILQVQMLEKRHMTNAFVRLMLGDDKVDEYISNWSADEIKAYNFAEYFPFSEEDLAMTSSESLPRDDVREVTIFSSIKERVFTKEEGLKGYTGSNHIFYNTMVAIGNAYDRLLQWEMISTGDTSTLTIYELKNGSYAYHTEEVSDETIEQLTNAITNFKDYLAEQGIDFLYVNTGSKICSEGDPVPAYVDEHILDNQDKLLTSFEKAGIATIDMREKYHQDGNSHEDAFYTTDPHWTFRTALSAAGIIADYANQNCDYEYNLDYFDIDNYEINVYESAFMGAQGYSLHLLNNKKEDFETVYPTFESTYHIEIPSRDYDVTGDYMTAFVNEERLNYSYRMYDSWRIRSDALVKIENLTVEDNADKTIALIYDSFSWPLITYLATNTGKVIAINSTAFNGSIKSYLTVHEPDLVVMVSTPRNIKAIDYSRHDSTFDLR